MIGPLRFSLTQRRLSGTSSIVGVCRFLVFQQVKLLWFIADSSVLTNGSYWASEIRRWRQIERIIPGSIKSVGQGDNIIIDCSGAWSQNEHLVSIQKEDYYV